MKRLILAAAIVLTCAVGPPRVSAQSAMFVYTGVPAAPVLPGASFTLQLSLQLVTGGTIGDMSGLSYWFAQSSPVAGPFPFQITNRNVNGSLFNDLFSGLVYPQVLDPINRNKTGTTTSTDLGALINTTTPGQVSGTYFIANVTFRVRPDAAAGTYTLGNTTAATPGAANRVSVWYDSEGDFAPISASPFNITVVPEPGSFALLCVGLVSVGALAYRRRAGNNKQSI